MKQKRFNFRILALTLLVALPLATQALERMELLPPNAELRVDLSNSTNLWGQLKNAPLGKLWADPQMREFLNLPANNQTLLEDIFGKDDGEMDLETKVFLQQIKLLKGEVAFAFTPEQEGPCIVAALGEEEYHELLSLDEELAESGDPAPFTLVKSSFQEVEIVQYIPEDSSEREPYWQAWTANTLLVGWSREWIEQSIVSLQQEKATEPTGTPKVQLHLGLESLIQEWVKEADGDLAPQAPGTFSGLFDALGLMGIGDLSIQIELKENQMVVDSTLAVSDLKKGIFALLEPKPVEIPNEPFIPESIVVLETGSINLSALWKQLPDIFNAISPNAKTIFDAILLTTKQQQGIDIETDLIANLGTKYISYSVVNNGVLDNLLAWKLNDSAAFQKALTTLFSAPSIQPKVMASLEAETFLDQTIYLTKNLPENEKEAFSILNGYLFYGSPDALRQAIRTLQSDTTESSIDSSPLVQGLRKNMLPNASLLNAVNWNEGLKTFLRLLSTPEFQAGFEAGWENSAASKTPPDFSKLPPADHLASFFKNTYQYMRAIPTGLQHRIIFEY